MKLTKNNQREQKGICAARMILLCIDRRRAERPLGVGHVKIDAWQSHLVFSGGTGLSLEYLFLVFILAISLGLYFERVVGTYELER